MTEALLYREPSRFCQKPAGRMREYLRCDGCRRLCLQTRCMRVRDTTSIKWRPSNQNDEWSSRSVNGLSAPSGVTMAMTRAGCTASDVLGDGVTSIMRYRRQYDKLIAREIYQLIISACVVD